MRAWIELPVYVSIKVEADTRAECMEQFEAATADLKFALRHETYSVGDPEIRRES